MRRTHRLSAVLAGLLAASVGLAACGGGDGSGSDGGATTLRLGYFPNLTHASAIVGVEDGLFADALGSDVELKTTTFNAGPAAVEALFSGAIDATYIGPGPTVNAYVKSKGKALKVISGATSGGAALVVKKDITSAAQLRGKKIATPQLGNTQDVALRFWLQEQGLKTTKEGGGDVKITPQENGQTLDTFAQGKIDGAWVPEPFVSRLVAAGGTVLLDERDLWPGGKFVTTHLVVRTEYLEKHPTAVEKLLQGQVRATQQINADPAKARQTVGDYIGEQSGKPLRPEILAAAWKGLTFTDDPLPETLLLGAEHAAAVGLIDKPELDGLYDLGPLNTTLKASGQPEVNQP